MTDGRLVITRTLFPPFRSHLVVVDRAKPVRLAPGSELNIVVEPGLHTVSTHMDGIMTSLPVAVDVRSGEIVTLRIVRGPGTAMQAAAGQTPFYSLQSDSPLRFADGYGLPGTDPQRVERQMAAGSRPADLPRWTWLMAYAAIGAGLLAAVASLLTQTTLEHATIFCGFVIGFAAFIGTKDEKRAGRGNLAVPLLCIVPFIGVPSAIFYRRQRQRAWDYNELNSH